MSTFSSVSDLLDDLAPDLPADPRWSDVLARAEVLSTPTRREATPASKHVGHPRRAFAFVVLAVMSLVAAVVVAAYALGHPVITFGAAPQAKSRTVVNFFGRMTVGAIPIPVLPDQAREITETRINGIKRILYVAPMKRGGFCWIWVGSAGGCEQRVNNGVGLDVSGFAKPTSGREPLNAISGTFPYANAETVEVAFADGARSEIPFVWVTRPISSGFFLYGIPVGHQQVGHQVVRLDVLGAHHQVIASQPVTGIYPPAKRLLTYRLVRRTISGYPTLHVPAPVVWASRKQLFNSRSDSGTHVGLWVGLTRDGGSCYWSNIHTGCSSSAGYPFWPKVVHGHGYAALCCTISTGNKVVAYFQDGDKVTLTPRQGYLIWPIPSRHYPPGHRLNRLVTYDANGAKTDSLNIPTAVRALYPCAKPINYGYGLVMCP